MRHRKEWIRAVNKIPFVSLNAFCLPALGKGRMRRVGAAGLRGILQPLEAHEATAR